MGMSNFGAAGVKPGVCTSTTRPATPYNGQVIYETDTGYLRVWDGSAWDYLSQSQNTTTNIKAEDIGTVWSNFTPNFRPETGVWFVASATYARYWQINKFVYGEAMLSITSFGTATNAIFFDLPVTAKQGNPAQLGNGREASITGQTFNVWRNGTTVGSIRFYNNGSTANNNYAFPFNFFYEAA
jgi:hypothetical protein